jgi:hypothetical protein
MAVAVGISFIGVGIAQAQAAFPIFTGKFNLATQVEWGNTVLQPGDYTITIASASNPMVLITDSKGRSLGFVKGINDGKVSARNTLLLMEKEGHLRVYSLELAGLKTTLVYDRVLAQEAVMEAGVPQTVPVMLTRR